LPTIKSIPATAVMGPKRLVSPAISIIEPEGGVVWRGVIRENGPRSQDREARYDITGVQGRPSGA
jgi:hypothetical protein